MDKVIKAEINVHLFWSPYPHVMFGDYLWQISTVNCTIYLNGNWDKLANEF